MWKRFFESCGESFRGKGIRFEGILGWKRIFEVFSEVEKSGYTPRRSLRSRLRTERFFGSRRARFYMINKVNFFD